MLELFENENIWTQVRDGDLSALSLFQRHYSKYHEFMGVAALSKKTGLSRNIIYRKLRQWGELEEPGQRKFKKPSESEGIYFDWSNYRDEGLFVAVE